MIQFCIYVIGPDSGFPSKIGVAENIDKRLANLQCANWERLYVYETFKMPSKGDAYRIERIIKNRLKANCIRGEWFNLFVSDITREVKSILEERFSATPLINKDKRKRRVLQYVV
jgi:hypothetical protein